MADFSTTEFFTPRQHVRLWRLADKGYCVFCEETIRNDDLDVGECPTCGNPILSENNVVAIQCVFCGHENPLPKPLDADMQCQKCGADL